MINYFKDVDENIKNTIEDIITFTIENVGNFYKLSNSFDIDFYFIDEKNYKSVIENKYPKMSISEDGYGYAQETKKNGNQFFDVFFKMDENFEKEFELFFTGEKQFINIFNTIRHEITHVFILKNVALQDSFFKYGTEIITDREHLYYSMFRVAEEYIACGQAETYYPSENHLIFFNFIFEKISTSESKMIDLQNKGILKPILSFKEGFDWIKYLFLLAGYYTGSMVNISEKAHIQNIINNFDTFQVANYCEKIHVEIINKTFTINSMDNLSSYFINVLEKSCDLKILWNKDNLVVNGLSYEKMV